MSRTPSFAAALSLLALVACEDHGHGGHHAAPPAPSGVNPVQHEMRLLNDALREAVTAIGNGSVKGIPEQLHRVHAAKEQTAAALKSGAYKPPKNGGDVQRFVALDEAFHADLEALVKASSQNDVEGSALALGKALAKCQGCHRDFRF